MYKFAQKGSVRYLRCEPFDALGFVQHAFCTRWNGVSTGRFAALNLSAAEGDHPGNVEENWRSIAVSFQLQRDRFVSVRQVHGDKVRQIEGHCRSHDLAGDAMITRNESIALCIRTADCLPVLLVDTQKRTIGAVHAGWRGTALQIAEKAVKQMNRAYSSQPGDMLAAMGPAIGSCCYEVDRPVYDTVRDRFPGWELSLKSTGNERWMFDLAAANRLQLINAGIPETNICSPGICTSCCQELFYSHRGAKSGTGRQLNFIFLSRHD